MRGACQESREPAFHLGCGPAHLPAGSFRDEVDGDPDPLDTTVIAPRPGPSRLGEDKCPRCPEQQHDRCCVSNNTYDPAHGQKAPWSALNLLEFIRERTPHE